ncbi:MAG: hypothetical protein AAF609_23900 [Cyanobacteria bacterium P01_C01_bin.120]
MMIQTKYLVTATLLCSAALMAGTAVRADDTLIEHENSEATTVVPEDSTLESSEQGLEDAEPVAEAEILECPPGQFPSAFADVYPFHWAYQAINNLASPRMECFDLPEEYR